MKFLKNRWWRKSRPSTKGVQLNKDLPPCLESYVPWWAWLFELISNLLYGKEGIIGYTVDYKEGTMILNKDGVVKLDANDNL